MNEQLLLGLALIIVLGIGAQWLAWRFRWPSILILLLCGFLIGPVMNILNPEAILGEMLSPLVSFAVGIILFEGGLSLRLNELQEVGKMVRNLLTIGVAVTWVMISLAAHFILQFNWYLAFVIGSILVVTGPTVILPLLRHIRPTGRIGAIARWEGITIDPVGAILAVLVLETVLIVHRTAAVEIVSISGLVVFALKGLLFTVFLSLGMSIFWATVLVLLLKRRLVPDYLQNSVALMVIIGAFTLSNLLASESGLLTATLMGIAIANQKYVNVKRIIDFKEDLRVQLIGGLFIMLSASLSFEDLNYIDARSLLFLGAIILLVRPVAVMLSSIGTKHTRSEKIFLSALAPRGVVAAAVVALFAERLVSIYPLETQALVPIVFLVIAGTVFFYSVSLRPIARRLGLAQPEPQGFIIVGAHDWARKIGKILVQYKIHVLFVDSNQQNIEIARQNGFEAKRANILSEKIVDELNLGGMGRILALTSNDEVNSLAALHFAGVFDSANIFQLSLSSEESAIPKRLRGRFLFARGMTFQAMRSLFEQGAAIKTITFDNHINYNQYKSDMAERMLPLFVIKEQGRIEIYSEDNQPVPLEGETLIALEKPQ
ncbi:sodium:proton antiporter [candidate division KSB1 bacterium]|nr:sodium:proton antiporter [candidate division KSB1 bacterium]